MHGGCEAIADQAADEVAGALLMRQVDGRRSAFFAAEAFGKQRGGAETGAPLRRRADQQDRFARTGKSNARDFLPVGDKANAGDRRGRQDATPLVSL